MVALFVYEENTHHAERIPRLAQEQEVHGQRDCCRHWDFNASRRLPAVRQNQAQRIDSERFQPANRLRGEAMSAILTPWATAYFEPHSSVQDEPHCCLCGDYGCFLYEHEDRLFCKVCVPAHVKEEA